MCIYVCVCDACVREKGERDKDVCLCVHAYINVCVKGGGGGAEREERAKFPTRKKKSTQETLLSLLIPFLRTFLDDPSLT